jgi:hypothetical protein
MPTTAYQTRTNRPHSVDVQQAATALWLLGDSQALVAWGIACLPSR